MAAKPTYDELLNRIQVLEKAAHERRRSGDVPHVPEERLKILSDAAYEALFLSEEGICVDQNLTAEKMFGYTREEALGRYGWEWIAPEDREMVRQNMLLDYAAPYQVKALRKDGTTFPCEIQARNLRYDGRIVRITSLRDISERRQSEQERENLQAKLTNAIEMAQLGPWEYDVLQDTFIFNDAFYKMFRTSAEEVGGYTMSSAEYARRFVHPDEMDLVAEESRRAAETNDPHYSRQLEHRIRYADGSDGYISVRIFIQKDANGKTIRTFGVNQDITERKRSEAALQRLNEALAQRTQLAEARTKQLQALAVELIDAEEQERRRIAQLLHDDLQQIMAGARHLLQAAMVEKSPEPLLDKADRFLGEAIYTSRRLSQELNPPILRQSGLSATLHWLSGQMREAHGLNVQLKTASDPQCENTTLKRFIYRAVQELLFNVVKHAGVKNARIDIAGGPDGITIKVSDEGRGFDPCMLDVFTEKTGVGLLSIRERVNYIGGSLDIESKPGQGSCFTLTLPPGMPAEEPAVAQEPLITSPKVMRNAGSLSVVFADDHSIMRQGLIRLVSGQPGIRIAGEAADGREAVELVRRVNPDVVLMDVSMPKVDGIEATRRIKAEFPATRVIGLSMHEDEHTAQTMCNAGAEAFVYKTASAADLLKAIYGIDRGSAGGK